MSRIFTLADIPPSSNHRMMVVMIGKKPRMILTPEYRRWMQQATLKLSAQNRMYGSATFNERVAVTIFVTFKNKKRRDVDNILKSVNDALTKAAIIADDSLIDVEIVCRCGPQDVLDGEAGLHIVIGPYNNEHDLQELANFGT